MLQQKSEFCNPHVSARLVKHRLVPPRILLRTAFALHVLLGRSVSEWQLSILQQ